MTAQVDRKLEHLIKQQKGFTLLEVLVAFSILAISLAVILAIFSRGMRTAALSEDYRQAMIIAENRMSEALYVQAIRAGVIEGEEQDYQWSTNIKALPETGNSGLRHELKRYQLEVAVSWLEAGKQRQLSLQNIALVEE